MVGPCGEVSCFVLPSILRQDFHGNLIVYINYDFNTNF